MLNGRNRLIVRLCLILLAEACIVLQVLGQGWAGFTSSDEAQYYRIAVNLLNHSTSSLSSDVPVDLTVYRTPGYPLLIALVHKIAFGSPVAMRILQFVLLGVTAFLLYQVGLLHFGRRAAGLGALICVTYPPLVFLSARYLTEAFSSCIAVGLILLVENAIKANETKLNCLFIGIMAGLLGFIRPSLVLSLAFIAFGVAWARMGTSKRADGHEIVIILAIITSGYLLVLSPWLIRNAVVSRRLLLAAGDGESLFCSVAQYEGKISYAFTSDDWQLVYLPGLRKCQDVAENKLLSAAGNPSPEQRLVPQAIRRELLLNECWRQTAVENFQRLRIVRIFSSIPKRIAYLWSTCDISPHWLQASVYHRFVQAYWLFIVLSATIGLIQRWRGLHEDWPILLFPTFITSIHLIFHVEARYSMPARPFVLLYSAAGLMWVFDSIRKPSPSRG